MKAQGVMDGELPQTMGYEAAGIVDQLGGGVADVGEGTTSTRFFTTAHVADPAESHPWPRE